MQGFKTFVANDVRLLGGQVGNVNAVLQVGDLTEKVEVRAGSELVQTQSATVASTLSVEQLSELPLVSRNVLYSVALLPGVSTTGGPRGAVINGLPNNTVNITIDGVTTGNMYMSTDGFFSMVTPRMDAVEEVTVTGAVPGSGGGAGSVQIQMTTRSGSNQFDGSAYHYWRQPAFNSNYYFNKVNDLPKNEVIAHQYGFRQGGPIVLPGLYDGRGKAFFFFNYEHLYQPSSATRTRQFLTADAASGIFRYDTTAGLREVNLLQLAANNGQVSTLDPTITSLLAKIRAGGRFLRPASDPGCIAIYRFDCNTPDINLNGPLFPRWDMRIRKRIPIKGRLNVEVMAEVLNVFDNINFNHSVDFKDEEDTFRVTSAYTDINTTFDPGGRIGQLVWRINW